MKASPGGSMSPFWDPLTAISTPNSSIAKESAPSPLMASTTKSACDPEWVIARRSPRISKTTPVEVSQRVAKTAFA